MSPLLTKASEHKALRLAIALFGSLLAGLLVAFVAYLVFGPTTLGGLNKYWALFFAACFFCLASLFIYRKKLGEAPEVPFLIILLTLTISGSILYNVNEPGWDLESHFGFMLSWTEADLSVDATDAEADILNPPSVTIDTSLLDLSGREIWLNSADATDTTDTTATSSAVVIYNRIASLPGTLVYVLCTALGLSFTLKFILAHLIYAIIYSFVCFFGMRKLKSGKMLFASIALLPTALFLASTYGYDYWVDGWMLYFGASLVGEMQRADEKITLGRALSIFIPFVLACGPKAIYFPLILICLCMPRSKFGSKAASRAFKIAACVAAVVVASTFLLSFVGSVSQGTAAGDARGGDNVSSSGQVAFILGNIPTYLVILFKFMVSYLGPESALSFVGMEGYLGRAFLPLCCVSILMIIFTCATDKGECDTPFSNWKTRLWVICVTYATLCLVATALYVSYTPVGLDTINGCQPRYIIPCLFSCLAFFGIPKIGAKVKASLKNYNFICLLILTVIPLMATWQLYVGLLH